MQTILEGMPLTCEADQDNESRQPHQRQSSQNNASSTSTGGRIAVGVRHFAGVGRPTLGRCRRTQDCCDLLRTNELAVLTVSAPADMSLQSVNGPLSPARQGSLCAMQFAFHSWKGTCLVPYCGFGGYLKGLAQTTSDRAWACQPHFCFHERVRSKICELSQPCLD